MERERENGDERLVKGSITRDSLASKQAAHTGTSTCDACSVTGKHTRALASVARGC